MDTRPRNAVVRRVEFLVTRCLKPYTPVQEMTLDGLEDDPNFWNDMNADEEEIPVRPLKDLTTSKSRRVLHILLHPY